MRFYRLQMKKGSDGQRIAEHFLSIGRITASLDSSGKAFNRLTPSDVILVHKGAFPLALVQVKRQAIEKELHENSFGVDYFIKILSNYDELSEKEQEVIDLYGNCSPTGTFSSIKSGNTYNKVGVWYNIIKEQNTMKEKLDILKFKNQIILQGPPGTGKTKLAKEIAKELTKGTLVDHHSKISNFFSSFNLTPEINSHRAKITRQLQEFQEQFKKEELKNISLEDYVLGSNKQTFCWWLEYGLVDLARYNGQAAKFKIYWNKEHEVYKKSGFIKDMDDQEAIRSIGLILDNIIHEENLDEAANNLSKSLVLKILISYFPDKYFPIVNEECIENTCQLLNITTASNNIFEKNLAIQSKFLELSEGKDIKNYEFMYFLFDNFQMKGKLTIEDKQVQTKGEYQIIQFHPSYSYEDFVRGITVKSDGKDINYLVEDKTLINISIKALDNPSANFVLIIDEINRANLPSVLGELIYALEYRYDPKNEAETTVSSMYSKDNEEENSIKLPKNLYIIGTMNTSDRSVGHIDYAIRRRFAFIDVLPEVLISSDFQKETFERVSSLFISNFSDYTFNQQQKLVPSISLNKEFRPEDVWIGHSYFIANDKEFSIRKKYEIVPILKEYIKDGILKDSPETWKIIDDLAL